MVHCPAVFLNTFAAENLSKFPAGTGGCPAQIEKEAAAGWKQPKNKDP